MRNYLWSFITNNRQTINQSSEYASIEGDNCHSLTVWRYQPSVIHHLTYNPPTRSIWHKGQQWQLHNNLLVILASSIHVWGAGNSNGCVLAKWANWTKHTKRRTKEGTWKKLRKWPFIFTKFCPSKRRSASKTLTGLTTTNGHVLVVICSVYLLHINCQV